MTNLPQAQNQPKPVSRMTPFSVPWLAELRRGLGTVNGKPVLMGGLTVREDQKRQISVEISRLQGFMRPCGREALAVELARLITAFPATADQSSVPADLRAEAYFEALDGIPASAVAEARGMIFRGEVPGVSPRFAPTPPEFRRICEAALRPIRRDLADLIAIRDAADNRQPSEAERERVSRGFEQLGDALRRSLEIPEALRRT